MKKFAFLIHPRVSAKEDMGKVFPPLKAIPERILRWGIKHLNPIVRGKVTFPGIKEVVGWIIVIPLTGDQIYSLPRDFVFNKIIQSVQKAKKLGVEIIGLGELISSITDKGKGLINRVDIGITTGNSLTSAITVKAIKKVSEMRRLELRKGKVAIVGAGGSVGKGVSLLLAEEGIPLILADRVKSRIEDLEKKIKSLFSENRVEITDDLKDFQKADIVIVATSATTRIIESEHLKKGAIVYDITQPRNTSPDLLERRRDITLIDGGVIDTPGINYGMDIGLRKEQAYACLVETMMLALEERTNNYIGDVSIDNAKEMLKLMEKYSRYFRLAPFQGFGKPLSEKLELII